MLRDSLMALQFTAHGHGRSIFSQRPIKGSIDGTAHLRVEAIRVAGRLGPAASKQSVSLRQSRQGWDCSFDEGQSHALP
ncbi:hypothetical protein ARZXY2_4514 (plasmid) [Arthrobacter sp. ZXY-2]|nr:hypothetical protein ARZXY2_4514 [Arthrobacter sp. ZXY-2]